MRSRGVKGLTLLVQENDFRPAERGSEPPTLLAMKTRLPGEQVLAVRRQFNGLALPTLGAMTRIDPQSAVSIKRRFGGPGGGGRFVRTVKFPVAWRRALIACFFKRCIGHGNAVGLQFIAQDSCSRH
jgi:hypothetical protein